MIAWLLGGLALLIAFFGWSLHVVSRQSMKDAVEREEQARLDREIFEGVIDVKRKIDNDLTNDATHAKRVRDRYNKTNTG